MLYCEHGGMCEVFGELYEITKDKKYLDLAVRFIDKENVDTIFILHDIYKYDVALKLKDNLREE